MEGWRNLVQRERSRPAIVETYRQPDGSVEMPEVLHPYLSGLTKITIPS